MLLLLDIVKWLLFSRIQIYRVATRSAPGNYKALVEIR